MKKKYLFTLILASFALTACGNKKMVCTGKGENDGYKSEIKTTVKFDKDGKYVSQDGEIIFEGENEEQAKMLEGTKDEFCKRFVDDKKATCDVKRSGKKVTFKVKNVVDERSKGKTKEDIKKDAEKADGLKITCK